MCDRDEQSTAERLEEDNSCCASRVVFWFKDILNNDKTVLDTETDAGTVKKLVRDPLLMRCGDFESGE